MNTFFANITEILDLKKDDDSSLGLINSENINDILEKNKNHPSVQEISQTFMTNEKILFQICDGRSSKRRNYESRWFQSYSHW